MKYELYDSEKQYVDMKKEIESNCHKRPLRHKRMHNHCYVCVFLVPYHKTLTQISSHYPNYSKISCTVRKKTLFLPKQNIKTNGISLSWHCHRRIFVPDYRYIPSHRDQNRILQRHEILVDIPCGWHHLPHRRTDGGRCFLLFPAGHCRRIVTMVNQGTV